MRALVATLGVLALGGTLEAQTRLWREDERVIVADFTVVQALAASDALLFVATAHGLGTYDHRFRRWAAPVTATEGYPREPVLAALADPADDAVWLGTATGALRYRPIFRQFESVLVPGGVRDFLYDRDDPFRGLYLLTSTGWQFLARGAFGPTPAPLPPPERRVATLRVEEVLARTPMVDAMQGSILLDERLRRFRYTSAAAVPTTEEIFLGTNGLGVIHVDPLVARLEALPFGLLATGAGAVVGGGDGVWVGSDDPGSRAGLTFVSDDLQRYEYVEGPRATGFGASAVRALLARGRDLWAATDRGIVLVKSNGDVLRLDTGSGLPDRQALALAAGPSGVWVGTARGLAFVPSDSLRARMPAGPAAPVLALAARGDTVWVGSTVGLGLAVPGDDVFVAPGGDTLPELREPIVALALVGDTLVAAVQDRLLWRAGAGPWHVERRLSGELGMLTALAADTGGVWVGGDRGLGRFGFVAREFHVWPSPGDVPGPVRGIAVTARHVWVATAEGLVRFTRRTLVP